MTLSLISLIFSFTLKNKWSFVLIGLSLLNIAMITLHGSRGAWLGIPIALIFIAIYFYKTQLKHTIFMLFTAVLLTLAMFYMPNSPLIERFDDLQSDTALMEKNNYNTSVGTRFALWQFAIDEFKQSPVVGNGFINFKNKICDPNSSDEVPNCQPHAHNIIFQELAAHGVIGLVNILLIAILTCYFFCKSLKHSTNPSSPILAFSGLISTLYLMICSMSDYLWFYSFPTMFTFLIILTLMNLIYVENLNHHHNHDS